MDASSAEGKFLYCWDEHNIFVYIIPALVFLLLLCPVLNTIIVSKLDLNALQEIVKVISKLGLTVKDLISWPLVLIYSFVISCILYVVGNVIASISTFVFSRVLVNQVIGAPDKSFSGGSNQAHSAAFIFLVLLDISLLILPFNFKMPLNLGFIPPFNLWSKIKIIIVIIDLLLVFGVVFFLRKIKKGQNKQKGVKKKNSPKSLMDKMRDGMMSYFPNPIKLAFKESFNRTFVGLKSEEVKRYNLWLPIVYMQHNYPSVFLQLKRFKILYSLSQNLAGGFLLALSFYIIFGFLNPASSIPKWLVFAVWIMGNFFLVRYLYKFYSTFSLHVFRAFIALKSSEKNPKKYKKSKKQK
jgi:hypothetical protein